jgi:ESCRT-I complex subunit VPS28
MYSHIFLLTKRYAQKCSNLITQYKAVLKDAEVQERFGDLDSFQRKYNVLFPSATYRLKVGVPATVEHTTASTEVGTDQQVSARNIAETVEVFTCYTGLTERNLLRSWMHSNYPIGPRISYILIFRI